MPSVAITPRPPVQFFHESSRLRSPRDSDDSRKQWIRNKQISTSVESQLQAVNQMIRKVEALRRRILGGAGQATTGWHFEDTIEVDPQNDYPAQSIIHIQATHDLVTTGIRDAANPGGGLITSLSGFWVSTQDVPAQSTSGGNDVWNLPQYPLPNPDDLDDATNFWIYLGDICP